MITFLNVRLVVPGSNIGWDDRIHGLACVIFLHLFWQKTERDENKIGRSLHNAVKSVCSRKWKGTKLRVVIVSGHKGQ